MDRLETFNEKVRKEISDILSQKYHTVRHGGHELDKDEFRRERKFWPDMQFHGAGYVGTGPKPLVGITFTPVNEPGNTYGFRIDLEQAIEAWVKRVGILKPREHPAMFAAELIWYMVTYIGAVDLADALPDAEGVRWINEGTEIFGRLPGVEDHHHA